MVVAEREECQLGGGIEELKLSVGHAHGGDDTARSDGEWGEWVRRRMDEDTNLTEIVGTLMFCMRTSK